MLLITIGHDKLPEPLALPLLHSVCYWNVFNSSFKIATGWYAAGGLLIDIHLLNSSYASRVYVDFSGATVELIIYFSEKNTPKHA